MVMTFFLTQTARRGFYKSTAGTLTCLSRPSMSANTPEDAVLKTGLIDDVMTVINIEGVYFCLYLG